MTRIRFGVPIIREGVPGSVVVRILTGACVLGVLLVVWGAFAVNELGYAWPYPRVLPSAISFHGATYFKQRGCHPRRWWDAHGGISGAATAQRLGTLRSALSIGGLPEYSLHKHAFDGYVLVASGGCYLLYQANASGY
jgi:hypothetical protein